MKTRSKLEDKSTSPGLRRKTSKTLSKDLQGCSSPDGQSSSVGLKGFDVRNKTPKFSRRRESPKVHTPGGDDILCSQHFDSQTVVGWDCNSPASIRNLAERKQGEEREDVEELVLRLIGEEPEDDVPSSRSTPPLLGLWRDKPKNQHAGPSGVPYRLRKRHARTKKKSSVSDVSHELLEKLQVALNNCSDVDKETDGRNAEGELYLPDLTELDEAHQPKDSTHQHNVSNDLFDTTCFKEEHVVASTAKLPSRKSLELCDDNGDTSWSDEELFSNDSFIVNATQMPVPKTRKYSSPIIGKKRKSNEKELPSSKCTRYSLSVGNGSNRNKTAFNEQTSAKYTSLMPKQSNDSCYKTKGNANQQCSSISSKPYLGKASVVTGPTSIVSRSKQSTEYNKNVISNSSNLSLVGTNFSNRTAPKDAQTSQSSTSSCASSPNSYPNNGNLSRSGSFKKHNSFSGNHKSESPTTLNRQRSLSGSNHQYTISKTVQTNQNTSVLKTNMKQQTYCNTRQGQANFSSRTFQNSSSKCISDRTQKSTDLNINNRTERNVHYVSGTVTNNSRSKFLSNNINKNVQTNNSNYSSTGKLPVFSKGVKKTVSHSPVLNKGSVINVFDTSLSDDLLCQLAEPDEAFESQLDTHIDSKHVLDVRSRFGVTDGAAGKMKYNPCASKQENGKKKFNFKPSQKPLVQKSNSNCQLKPDTKTLLELRKPVQSGIHLTKEDKKGGELVNKQDKGSAMGSRRDVGQSGNASSSASNTCKDFGLSEDLFSDDDDLLGDNDGLNEAQIFAMLDEAEYMATQKSTDSRQSFNQLEGKQSHEADIIPNRANSQVRAKPDKYQGTENRNDQREKSLTDNVSVFQKLNVNKSSDKEQDNLSGSPELPFSQSQPSSQGQMSSSQIAKYTAAEIERKKQMALERRQKRLRESQI